MSASSALFGQEIRPELDPAQLLDELRATRPLLDRLARAEPVVGALDGISVGDVQQLHQAIGDVRAIERMIGDRDALGERLERLEPLVDRLELLASLVDMLEALDPDDVRELRRAIDDVGRLQQVTGERNALLTRLDRAAGQLHRIEELLELLDQLEVLVGRPAQ